MAEPKQKLRWRCRRGVRELDVLLTDFLERRYDMLDEQQRCLFEEILEVQDPVLMDWIFEREQPEQTEYRSLLDLIRGSLQSDRD